MSQTQELRLPALEVRQSPGRVLYSFAVDGKLLPSFTTVSRVKRDPGDRLQGYQRPEVLRHVAEIRGYLESPNPIIPNAIVIAFNDCVRFEPAAEDAPGPAFSRPGTLVIPVDDTLAPEDRPGWIVDGQQRAAAIREARIDSFPIFVTAFITRHDSEQREQFILVNSTRPLPRGLIYELLPDTEARLPPPLERRRFPAALVDRLNYDGDSPLKGMIQTPTNPEGRVKDNSILKMLENSLGDGALHGYRDSRTGEGDIESMLDLLKSFWTAVRLVFPKAWDRPPRESRLMHGAGIVSMGFVMDAISERFQDRIPTAAEFADELQPLAPLCRWTSGAWDFGDSQRKWNEIQNTTKDILLLSDYLLQQHRKLAWKRNDVEARTA
jgi:DGQHR domain-containing protein